MGLLSRFVKSKYNDEQIVVRAENAITEDPAIANGTALGVSSQKGVVTLTGTVASDREKVHVEGTVRSALRQAGLKFERIENRLATGR